MPDRIYFASDFHLGVDAKLTSAERERLIVAWLREEVAPNASALYLLGDLFEFWFEYRHVVPRGYVRLLGTLAELRDRGLQIDYFTGNHDLWMGSYFEEELGIATHRAPIRREHAGMHFLIGHGDGLGPGDKGYKRMKRVFSNPAAQWAFARLHPDFAVGLARLFSDSSRAATPEHERTFLGAEREWLVQYAERKTARDPALDYCIFGHRHLPIEYLLRNGRSRYVNLGDWLDYQTYAVFDGLDVSLRQWPSKATV